MGDRPMSATNELLRKWLEKFGDAWDAGPPREGWQSDELLALIEQTRAALVERKAEPVAWLHPTAGWASASYDDIRPHCQNNGPMPVPLYSTPPAAPVRVTEKMIDASAKALAERNGSNRWEAFKGIAEAALTSALSASPSPVGRELIERLVTPHSYAQEYEFRGDGGDYVPTDGERTMIEDAICGYLGELAEAHLALAAKEQQP